MLIPTSTTDDGYPDIDVIYAFTSKEEVLIYYDDHFRMRLKLRFKLDPVHEKNLQGDPRSSYQQKQE